MLYDYLIVGAGLYGATFARLATDAGRKCLVIDKRDKVSGNIATEESHGINELKIEILRLQPQNDIMTHSPRGEGMSYITSHSAGAFYNMVIKL